MTQYTSLKIASLADATGYQRPYFYSPSPVKAHGSALEVMTDLKFVPAATVLADADVDTASQLMIARGVRLLLVIDGERNVVGLVTARDLLGDKPGDVARARGIALQDVRTGEVMTPKESIEVLELADVLQARVGDIIATLKNSWRQHALVVDHDPMADKPVIRGIFSASQIARQLGIAIPSSDLNRTFADIDRVIEEASGN
jgi:CBS domain-containing protein